jgi:muramidase (phage lysozyme)
MNFSEMDSADPFSLTNSVGLSGANDRGDVIRAQTLLANTGYLELPAPGVPTGWPSADLLSGISRLQKDNGLEADGLLLPLPRGGVGANGEGETLQHLKTTVGPTFNGYAVLTPDEVDRFHELSGRQDGEAAAASAGIVTLAEKARSGAPAGTRPARAAKRNETASPEQNRAVVADLLDDPRVRAFLDTLADRESGGRYDVINGGGRFDGYAGHPNTRGSNSTAAGAYQFTRDTWADMAAQLGLSDFTPASQDQAAVHLLTERPKNNPDKEMLSAIGRLQRGDIEGAIFAAGKRWGAFPKDASASSISGGTRQLKPIIDQYNRRLKDLQ